ncbi:hypothetical protein DQ04_03821050 [Trypanosoma grayi]|uniref:hypothetical protein n=1 Tax=Trypanosoma grayi TaxID=71804 RepID=UPI0004F46C1E|nr:hypothetical protein DQ04_03821050 [Trypanosoma grayi]KEG10363.1 hypothetical protein DQ04_03821050 [Trypanosoma grayi]
MQVLAVDDGGLCALSPNQSLYAVVTKGLTVVFMDYIRRTSELMSSDPLAGENGDGPSPSNIYNDGSPRAPDRCVDAVISKHIALDEIHELQWSPDSSLVALLLARRRVVEIVSVYGKCCVARIDAGIAGLRAVRWHPSSRVVYWVGLLQAHVLSLVDSQVMRLAGGVKYSAQLAARRLTASPAPRRDTSSCAATAVVELPVSEAALLRFSTCRRFLLYVTPKSLRSPLLSKSDGQTIATRATSSEMAPPSSPPASASGEGETSNRPRRSEWLVVASATTHEELHAFPTGQLVSCVSECIPLQGGIALVDYVHGSLALTTHNGARVLHQEASGVQNVVSSKNGAILLIVFADACRAVLVSKKRVMALRQISFHADVLLSLRLRELPVLEEPMSAEDASMKLARGGAPYRRCVGALGQLNNGADWSQGETRGAPLAGHAAISASGQMAAVTLGLWPSCVLVLDILRQRVMAVLRHCETVMGLFWSPSPCSEYWGFQQRHYIQQKRVYDRGAGHATPEAAAAATATTAATAEEAPLGLKEPLLVTSDNHDAKVFLWLANCATCYVAPRLSDGSMDITNRRKQRSGTPCHSGELPKVRLNRGMLGGNAADAVLVDDVRGIAITVAFRNEEGEVNRK